MKRLRNLLCAFVTLTAALALAACVQNAPVLTEDTVITGNDGVLVVSLSKWERKQLLGTGGLVSLIFRSEDATDELALVHQSGIFGQPSEFEEKPGDHGRVLSSVLPAGEYVLSDWELSVGTGNGTITFSPKEPEPVPFEIRAGEITYLGNLHLDTVYKANFLGYQHVVSARPSSSDKRERDLPIFYSRFAQYKNWPVRFNILDVEALTGISP